MTATGDSFDIRKIRRLVELMKEHELSEMDLRDGNVRIRLRKEPSPVFGQQEPRYSASPSPASSGFRTDSGSPAESSKADAHLAVVKSIMVGTFFTAASPDAAPFVKVGDHVGPDSTVCIIEAMKVFNEIVAGVSGQIVAVLVQNGDPVEFGQPLFKVDIRQ